MAELDIKNIDKAMATDSKGIDGMDWYTADSPAFDLSGFYWRTKGGAFRRLPDNEQELAFSPNVRELSWHTSGGMLRFKSDATEIRVKATVYHTSRMDHMTLDGSMGFDLYVGNGSTKVFSKNTRFANGVDEYCCTLFQTTEKMMREFTIHFPLYSGVKKFEAGLSAGSEVAAPTPWNDPCPVVVYGTSITQGGCASRPGMLHTNIMSRMLNRPFINLGFSGSGKGEPEMAEIMAGIKGPAMFVLAYDSNAGPERLEKTLEPFIRILRKKHPITPILTISAEPKSAEAYAPFSSDYASKKRPEFTRIHTENLAKFRAEGDNNIYFLDGMRLYGQDFAECTVDGGHATDLGFYRMAHTTGPIIDRILSKWWL